MKSYVELMGLDVPSNESSFTQETSIASTVDYSSQEPNDYQQDRKTFKEIADYINARFKSHNYYCHSWDFESSNPTTMKIKDFKHINTTLSNAEALQYMLYITLESCGSSEFAIIDTQTAIQCLKDVMQYGINLNQPYKNWFNEKRDHDDITPLSQAASCKNIILVNFLLDNGAIVTPSVLRAISHGVILSSAEEEQLITNMLERGVNINMCDDNGGILHGMFFGYDAANSFIKFLLQNGLKPNLVDKNGISALHNWVNAQNDDISITLIEHGADLYLKDNNNVAPIDLTYHNYFKYRIELYYNRYQEQLKINLGSNKETGYGIRVDDKLNQLAVIPAKQTDSTKSAIMNGEDETEQAKGAEGKDEHGRKGQQAVEARDYAELPVHPEHSEESSQTKDELDVKLQKIIQEFVKDKPEYAEEINKIGYKKLKEQLVEYATSSHDQLQEQDWWGNITSGIKELFGVSEAEAAIPLIIPAAEIIKYGGATLILVLTASKLASESDGNNWQSDLEKRKHDDNSNKPSTSKQQHKVSATFMPSGPNDNDPDDEFSHFKKQDGSNRYECEKQESPEWKNSQNFKDEFRTNGGTGKNKEYYRWDMKHKDIEVYDNKARLIGSKYPVTGKIYRQGNMMRNEKLWGIIK